jgi:hypothetical protein
MTDETVLAEAGEPETTTLDTAQTPVTPKAWSQADPEAPDLPAQHSWRRTVGVAACMVIGAAALAVSLIPAPDTAPTAAPTTTAPTRGNLTEIAEPSVSRTTTTRATPPVAASPPSWQTKENQFLALVRLDGTYDGIVAHGGAGHARLLCSRLEAGESHLTDHEERPTLYDIVDVYCPDFDPRGADAVAQNLGRVARP